MKKKRFSKFLLYVPIILVLITSIFIFVPLLSGQTAEQQTVQTQGTHAQPPHTQIVTKKKQSTAQFYAAAISVGLACIAAGIAVSQVGSAAIGAISEKPELFGRTLTFVGLSEGIAIWGLIIAILILYS